MTGYQSKRAAAQDKLDDDDTQVYQRPWVGLTDDERLEVAGIDAADEWFWKVVEAIEAKLREKNT